MTERIAFLDRDGTIIRKAREGEYVTNALQVELLQGAAEGIRMLNAARFRCFVVTNQRGVARGVMSVGEYFAVHAHMIQLLSLSGAEITAEFHCFHGVNECACRKPGIGMLENASGYIGGSTKAASVMVGDANSDIECGRRFGVSTVRISAVLDAQAHFTARNLALAAEWIIANVG